MERQRGGIDQVATAIHQMSLSAHEIARDTVSASLATDTILRTIEDGTELIERTTAIVARQGEDLAATNQQVGTLSLKSDRIGVVLSLIRDIAEQTNLLALNAAIEAARAGEQGRGFAVVADEVRSLAQRTQDSIQEIRSIIEALQGDTQSVVQSMAVNQHQVSETGRLFAELVESLYGVGSGVIEIARMNGQIASAAEEQSAVAEEINTAVERIRLVSDELTEHARASADDTRAVGELVMVQGQLLARFRA
ncbi:methyl-accepting chemotaxis protein [Pseudomonas sp.]|uniref:methyl-accepting chemotaxis protein n=1 Tax=Pseudomonas sp. TaxID=306 RepID=UPI0035617BFA